MVASAGQTYTSSFRPCEEEVERIVERAYEIYLNRGGAFGISEEDWRQAETGLRHEAAGVSGSEAA